MLHNNEADTQKPAVNEKWSAAAEIIVIAKTDGVKLEWKGSSKLVVTGTLEAVTLWLPILTSRKEDIMTAIFLDL